MSDTESGSKGPKKTWNMNQAIAAMSAGGVLFAAAIIVPAEQGTPLYFIKLAVGVIGLCVLGVGAYYRPMKPNKSQN